MSKRNVAPAKRGTAQVRPPRSTRTTTRTAPAPQPEPATPKALADFSPKAYVKALEKLRLDIRHGELALEVEALNAALRCRGVDVLAGELVANALRAEHVEPWQLIDILLAIVERHAAEHSQDVERSQTFLLIAATRWVRVEASGKVGLGAAMLAELVGKEWGEDALIRMALAVLDYYPEAMPDSASSADGYSDERLDFRTRQFIRAVFDYAGLHAARAAVEDLRKELEHRAGQRTEVAP